MLAFGGVDVLRGGGMWSACRTSSRRQNRGIFRGAYLVKRGCRGSLGLGSGWEGCVGGVMHMVYMHIFL